MKKKNVKKATKRDYLVQFNLPSSLDVHVKASNAKEARRLAKEAAAEHIATDLNGPIYHVEAKRLMVREWGYGSGVIKAEELEVSSVDLY